MTWQKLTIAREKEREREGANAFLQLLYTLWHDKENLLKTIPIRFGKCTMSKETTMILLR